MENGLITYGIERREVFLKGKISICFSPITYILTRNGKHRNQRGTVISEPIVRRPAWLKVRPFSGERYHQIRGRLKDLSLHTVCEEANCPNRGECYNSGTATFLLMGPICSRNCRFCNVTGGQPRPLDPDEPEHVASMAGELDLSHVVITSVTRDDLPDQGAEQFQRTVAAVRRRLPEATIEILTPDFGGRTDLVDIALAAAPTVFNHNVETVPRLYPMVRPQADFARSLGVLTHAARTYPAIRTKSGVMVGLGEKIEELDEVFAALASAGVTMLTIGQYLPPSLGHFPLDRFYTPDEFAHLARSAEQRGIPIVVSAPLVRSSYKAALLLP
jgi:lipoyl synthase